MALDDPTIINVVCFVPVANHSFIPSLVEVLVAPEPLALLLTVLKVMAGSLRSESNFDDTLSGLLKCCVRLGLGSIEY